MLKDKWNKSLLVATGVILGLGAGIVGIVSAQNTTASPLTNSVNSTTSVDTPEPGDLPDTPNVSKTHGHAPLGGDGIISSINGTTVVIAEEADEGGASYTVDASGATITKSGVAGKLSDLKVGDKVFVQGTVNGTNVTATSISNGFHGGHKPDNDIETNDDNQ